MNFIYIKNSLREFPVFSIADIRNSTELRQRLLLRCTGLDFRRLAKDLEPFVYSKKEVNQILMFLDFIQQEI